MKSYFKQLLEDDLLKPSWAQIYGQCATNLQRKIYPSDYVNQIMQGWQKHSIADVMAFARIHTMASLGKIWTVGIVIGDTPKADKAVKKNNAVLKRLSPMFKAEFIPETGPGAWSDGYFHAPNGIVLDNGWSSDGKKATLELPRLWLPLEVGTTAGYVTLLHLLMDGGVVRWAYDSKAIVIMYTDRQYFKQVREGMFKKKPVLQIVEKKPKPKQLDFFDMMEAA